MKGGTLGLGAGLGSGTCFAGLDIGLDVLVDFGPPIVSEDKFFGLLDTGVSYGDVVMAAGDDLSSYCMVAGHIDPLVIIKESILFLDSLFMVE